MLPPLLDKSTGGDSMHGARQNQCHQYDGESFHPAGPPADDGRPMRPIGADSESNHLRTKHWAGELKRAAGASRSRHESCCAHTSRRSIPQIFPWSIIGNAYHLKTDVANGGAKDRYDLGAYDPGKDQKLTPRQAWRLGG